MIRNDPFEFIAVSIRKSDAKENLKCKKDMEEKGINRRVIVSRRFYSKFRANRGKENIILVYN